LFFQIRCTLWCDMPAAAAMLRVLHFFLPFGGCSTRVITCRTLADGSQGFRPRPGRSRRPSSPCRSKRRDQVDTVLILTLRAAATSASREPSARRSTIRARRPSLAEGFTARPTLQFLFFVRSQLEHRYRSCHRGRLAPPGNIITSYLDDTTLAGDRQHKYKTAKRERGRFFAVYPSGHLSNVKPAPLVAQTARQQRGICTFMPSKIRQIPR
jgi:hypothetical protein